MPYKILHLADLHLETSFAAGGLAPALGTARRRGLREALERLLGAAAEHQADAITIAGDLYDHDYALPRLGEYLAERLAELAPIRVLIAPGERDPFTSDSLYALARWPDNVHIFPPGRATRVELAPGLVMWGAASPPAKGESLLEGLEAGGQGTHLLLAHAADGESAGRDGGDLPVVTPDAVRQAGLRLALLGHRHQGGRVPDDGEPVCLYPGSPEPLAADEQSGGHHGLLVTIDDDGALAVEPISVARWRYAAVTVDLTGCGAAEEAGARIEQALWSLEPGADEHTICTVTLVARPGGRLDLHQACEQVETEAQVRYLVRLEPGPEIERLAEEPTVRGMLARRLNARLERVAQPEERRQVLAALDLALQALDGKAVQRYEVA